jgi:hypothetical protein
MAAGLAGPAFRRIDRFKPIVPDRQLKPAS